MLDPRLFTEPQFLASIAGALFSGVAAIGLMSYSPAVMQRVARWRSPGRHRIELGETAAGTGRRRYRQRHRQRRTRPRTQPEGRGPK